MHALSHVLNYLVKSCLPSFSAMLVHSYVENYPELVQGTGDSMPNAATPLMLTPPGYGPASAHSPQLDWKRKRGNRAEEESMLPYPLQPLSFLIQEMKVGRTVEATECMELAPPCLLHTCHKAEVTSGELTCLEHLHVR